MFRLLCKDTKKYLKSCTKVAQIFDLVLIYFLLFGLYGIEAQNNNIKIKEIEKKRNIIF